MKVLLFLVLILSCSCWSDDSSEAQGFIEENPVPEIEIPVEEENEIEIINDDEEVDDIDLNFEELEEGDPEGKNPVFPLTSTSTSPRYYKDFTKSPAYKKYTSFAKLYQSKYTSVMPGVTSTDVNGSTCKNMVPQGIAIAKDYLLISAYDSDGKYKSVLYAMSNAEPSNRKYVI